MHGARGMSGSSRLCPENSSVVSQLLTTPDTYLKMPLVEALQVGLLAIRMTWYS